MATSGLLAACGGGGGGGGSDEDYVRAVCESSSKLEGVLAIAIGAALSGGGDGAEEVFAEALEEWVDEIDDANPPADAADAHNRMVDGLNELIDALKSGDTNLEDSLDNIDIDAEPPEEVQERLAAVAADTLACNDVSFFD